MHDTVYLTYDASGVSGMRKTRPTHGTYIRVRLTIPDPPTIDVNLPQASPSVTATHHVEPSPVDGRIFCDHHGEVHDPDDLDPYEDTDTCDPDNHHPVYHEIGYTP